MLHPLTILYPARRSPQSHGVPMSFLRTISVGGSALLLATACQHSQPVDEHMAHMSAGDMSAQAAGAAGQGAMNLPPSANSAAARLSKSPRHGEWVKTAWEPGSKDSIMSYIV